MMDVAAAPLVSVVIASFNSAAYLESAIASALRQDLAEIEVIVVDDGSSDNSIALARTLAECDPRVRVDVLPENRGPAGARNRGLELARGRWYAVLDSDDLWHPDRLKRLLDAAAADDADILADNLLLFADDQPGQVSGFFGAARAKQPTWLSLEDYLHETRILVSKSNLGYLKPVIRLDRLRAAGVRYDESLRIGEDDDLLLRLLKAGLRCRLYPEFGYFYRRHSSSISHRLTASTIQRIEAQEARFRAELEAPSAALLKALDGRRTAARNASAFVDLVDALKARQLGAAARIARRRPSATLLLRLPVAAALSRLVSRKPSPPTITKPSSATKVCLISRQRLVGSTNGSSAYLLDLVQALVDARLEVHLLQPSPVVLGRWPVLQLKPVMDIFASIQIRGVVRIGRWVIARDPKIYGAAARGLAAQVLARLKLPSAWLGGAKAPYAIAAPWAPEDMLFVARHAPETADRVVLDYAFQTFALPYVLRPDAPSAVVMHDLFHSRAATFGAGADSVAALDEAAERILLGRADVVIAIQAAEAQWVARALPETDVILAPIAAHPTAAPQPGEGKTLLFVGSNTAPNVLGLRWFFDEIWSTVLAAHPTATLKVAGNVARAFPTSPERVEFLGVVEDLNAAYAPAAIVISPLTAGSGLKIKLIEAIAQGKAVVATAITLQGVEEALKDAVIRADEPEAFATALIHLLDDTTARMELAARALAAARTHFSPTACYGEFVRWASSRERSVPARTAGGVLAKKVQAELLSS
jgi:succinoglycan biosynthesis protein ExoO